MVCRRCIIAVRSVLEQLEIDYLSIDLCMVKLASDLNPEQQKKLSTALKYYDLELMDNKKKILVERIKTSIVELFHSPGSEIALKFSDYLSKTLHYEYTYMANIFSETEGSTIERFYIEYRIERVKELLVYETLSIKEIAYQLYFSSESHLCQQFKKITGLTPSVFRKRVESEELVWRQVNDIR